MEESGVSQETCIYWKFLQLGPKQKNIVRNLKFDSILNVKFMMKIIILIWTIVNFSSLVCRMQNRLPAFVHAGVDNCDTGDTRDRWKTPHICRKSNTLHPCQPIIPTAKAILFCSKTLRGDKNCPWAGRMPSAFGTGTARLSWGPLTGKSCFVNKVGHFCTFPHVTTLSWQSE